VREGAAREGELSVPTDGELGDETGGAERLLVANALRWGVPVSGSMPGRMVDG
jgi:hypothetical protein